MLASRNLGISETVSYKPLQRQFKLRAGQVPESILLKITETTRESQRHF